MLKFQVCAIFMSVIASSHAVGGALADCRAILEAEPLIRRRFLADGLTRQDVLALCKRLLPEGAPHPGKRALPIAIPLAGLAHQLRDIIGIEFNEESMISLWEYCKEPLPSRPARKRKRDAIVDASASASAPAAASQLPVVAVAVAIDAVDDKAKYSTVALADCSRSELVTLLQREAKRADLQTAVVIQLQRACRQNDKQLVRLKDDVDAKQQALVELRAATCWRIGKNKISAFGCFSLALLRNMGHASAQATLDMVAGSKVAGGFHDKNVVIKYEHEAACDRQEAIVFYCGEQSAD